MKSRSRTAQESRASFVAPLSIIAVSSIAGASAHAQSIVFSEPSISAAEGLAFPMDWEDFNQDGRPDLAVVADGVIKVFLSDGMNGFTQSTEFPYYDLPPYIGPPVRIVAADLDGDGAVDLSWLEYVPGLESVVTTWYNSGDGINGTVVQMVREGGYIGDLAVLDISSDGLADIVVTHSSQAIGAYINRGQRTFDFQRLVSLTRAGSTKRLLVGDVDGDGDLDLAILFQYGFIDASGYTHIRGTYVAIFTNSGDLQFELAAATTLPWQTDDVLASDLHMGDLDGDSDLDLVAAGWQERSLSPNVICLLENRRTQELRSRATIELGDSGPCRMALGDFNTNGRLDMAFVDESATDENIDIFENRGGWEFERLGPVPSAAGGGGVVAADFSTDGQIDLVRSGTAGLSLLENITALTGPTYQHTALVRGQPSEFVVTGAEPGERVNFVYSLTSKGFSRGVRLLGGMTLDLGEPWALFGAATADGDGRAAIAVVIPPNAPLTRVTTQAVIRRGPGGVDSVKTPFRTARITD